MERITTSHVRSAFEHFCSAHGFKMSSGFDPATRRNDPGLALDHAASYGGWVIVELNDRTTGESQPFGITRKSSKEMYDMLWFATHVADYEAGGHAGSAARARRR